MHNYIGQSGHISLGFFKLSSFFPVVSYSLCTCGFLVFCLMFHWSDSINLAITIIFPLQA